MEQSNDESNLSKIGRSWNDEGEKSRRLLPLGGGLNAESELSPHMMSIT